MSQFKLIQRQPESVQQRDPKSKDMFGRPSFIQPQALMIHMSPGDWVKDGDGNLYYKTKEEAEVRMAKLKEKGDWEEYRVVSFSNSQGEFWRVEMKGRQEVEEKNEEEENEQPEEEGVYYYQETDENAFRAWKRLKEEGKTSLSWSEFAEMNGGEEALTHVKAGAPLKLGSAKSSSSTPGVEAAGDLESNKIMYVAWTIDDGPFGNTTELMKTKGLEGVKNVTWYIQRWRMGSGDAKYNEMKSIQDAGGEIAIHSFHPTSDHVPWFPLTKGAKAYTFPYAGQDQSVLMADLKSFHAKLETYGIKPKFARLPGGLTSELYTYATNQGYGSEDAKKIRTSVLEGKDVSSFGEKAVQIQKDYKLLKSTLSELDLLLWGGGMVPEQIKGQSWEAETSGSPYRTDNATKKVSSQRSGKETNPGVFERRIAGMGDGEKRSLVVLAHDTLAADSDAVLQDKKEMERIAKDQGIRIEYVTMSTLFEHNTGENTESYDVNY